MVWRGVGRLSALVVIGFAAPLSAEPIVQIAQAEQGAGGAPAESAAPTVEPEALPAGTPEPDAQAETPAPTASPPPKQSDAELETITVKPLRQTPRTTTVARKPAPGASAGEPGGAQAASAATTAPPLSLPESAFGPVDGFVATRSATGIKTDTPIVEIPQSISVITADRMEQLRATTLNEALNYTAGVRPNVYGSDARYDWVSIRGFDAFFPGFYFDGLFARNNNTWAVWRVEPYGAERIEVLRHGTHRDAILHGISANSTHGLRRTQADRRRAVERLLTDPEWAKWSDRKIADAAKVDHKTVGKIRRELSGEIPTGKSMGGEFPSSHAKPNGKGRSILESVLRSVSDEALVTECRRRGIVVEASDV